MKSNYLPPLEPIGDFRSYVCGDVVIDETAAIAAGVLLQADQGSQIIIAAGVCIGMGTVIHVQSGLLEIGAGANLGAGVLVYGNSKIGEGACIGASSSIVNAAISKGGIVPPCSLISGLEESSFAKEASPEFLQDLPVNSSINIETPQSPPDINQVNQEVISDFSNLDGIATNHQDSSNNIETPIVQDGNADPVTAVPDINSMIQGNSAQAKAYAQSQINRYIKRLYPQNDL